MAEQPEFIPNDVQTIIDGMVADYEARTGRTLQPAQVERLLINSFAYRESLLREKIQYAAIQNLVLFSSAPYLDYLGQLVGVTRLAASRATTTLQFSLVGGHGGVTIPAGMRVASADAQAVFAVTEDTIVPPGVTPAFVTGQALEVGTRANNYLSGSINNILDPIPFVSACTNTTTSGGGAEQETDEALRERIILAPSSFSNAGSRGAYKYFAMSANPSIIDVAVLGPPDTGPGEVEVYPLMEDGSVTPGTVLTAVDNAVNSEKVRPLTDLVTVIAPTRTDYDIEVDITTYTTADPTEVQALINERLNDFVLAKRKALGQDIKLNQIIAQCMVDGVYDVAVGLPAADIIIAATEYGFCNTVTVNIVGSNNG